MGHRGARFEAPENTLAGFRYAVDLGLTAVELDVRLTADGEVVIMHDETVDRTTDGQGPVATLTLAELRALDARSTFSDWDDRCQIPTLGEALDTLAGMSVIEVELKRDSDARMRELVPKVVSEIRSRGLEQRVILTSFDPFALTVARDHAPDIRRCFIGNWDSSEYLDTVKRLECVRGGVRHAFADHGIVEEAQRQGLDVVCWPVNSVEELESALSFSPDVICTDSPTLIRNLLADRAIAVR